jgi:hypothetical protein
VKNRSQKGIDMAEGPRRFGVIIGGMKCGTTSLFDYLARHPHVCASAIKETNFFSGDEFKETDLTNYHRLWPDWCAKKHEIAIEASPNYTKIPSRPNVAHRFAQFEADWRFVYLLRHPLERIESHLTHGQAREWNTSEANDHHIACSMYARQLDAYVDAFGSDSVLIVQSSDLRQKRTETLRRITDFLSLSTPVPQESASGTRNEWTAHRKDHPLVSWARQRNVLRAVGKLVPVGARRWIRRGVGTPVSRMKLDQESQHRILSQLRPDLVRLRDVYGVDASTEWGISI